MRYPNIAYILALSLILGICLSCSSDHPTESYSSETPGEPDTPDNYRSEFQRILFEVSYVNFAWGYQCRGFYVDTAGQVFTYYYHHDDEPWRPNDPHNLTEADLMEKYSHNSTLVTTLDLAIVTSMRELISAAAQGEVTEPRHEYCDFGATAYIAYRYNNYRKVYLTVDLYQYGDWVVENNSEEAGTLVDWLKSLGIDYQ